jgi:hypothetical protein
LLSLKQFIAILICLFPVLIFAQDSGIKKITDTSFPVTNSEQNDSSKNDSVQKIVIQQKGSKKDTVASTIISSISPDSLSDSLKRDSIKISAAQPIGKKVVKDTATIKLMPGIPKAETDNDIVFYTLVFLVFFLALIKTSFPRYFGSIFTLSFQASFRQSQTREQMAQNFFPAFMLNILFILSGGVFITLFAQFNNWAILPYWKLFIYSTAILLAIYLIKYIVISFTGWVFNAEGAASEYRFVVFLINKLLGVVLIPLLFLIAYADNKTKSIAITIVLCLAFFSLAIRYIVSLARIRRNLSITAFHFFIYLCAVEIMPLLVIYKVLFQQTSNR